MRVPRDISGRELIKRLEVFGYLPTRQSGSHVRVTARGSGEHHITVPMHDELRVGTLNSIISAIAIHFSLDKAEVIRKLFRP
jgi:predicted RNA binding protein YcfA (HicA-like mRNA interferase family)